MWSNRRRFIAVGGKPTPLHRSTRVPRRPPIERHPSPFRVSPEGEGRPKPPFAFNRCVVALRLGGRALDRVLALDADLDLARLLLLRLAHVELEHAVLVGRAHVR